MTASQDLTTETGLCDYLKAANGQSKPVDIEPLSGGTANYVYRVTNQGARSIYKHAAPYLHSNKSFAFDPTRMDYEARVLEILSPASSESPLSKQLPTSCVHAVQILSYDKDQKLLCIEDGGSQHLKDAYTDLKLDIPHVGEELAKWIAALHACSSEISLALPGSGVNVEGNNNNPVAINIYRYSYKNLYDALARFGQDPELAHRINERFGSLLKTDNECICHGDFWPGNVLVQLNSHVSQIPPDSTIDGKKPVEFTVVDWEMCRRGTSATDVGQFAAEAWLLDCFRGDRGLLPAFLIAYATARESGTESAAPLGRAWLRRMVVHWAVHVAFWPTVVEWTGKDGTQKLVDIGVDVLKDVLDENWEKLLESPLLRGVKEAYAPLLTRP
ncbi:kinase-like protein [Clathrospora elynae]|uniref:Kinase-like protein n=1 Tax=Clathrospora elynae TaxID=706981 RepID=A0A6A5SN51_9PLEO|nr:kinase-like protein [Clathrospora elynae]